MENRLLITSLCLLLVGTHAIQGSAAAPRDLTDDELKEIILRDNQFDMASYLNDHPEIIDKKEIFGTPLLYFAAAHKAHEIVSLLIMRGWNYQVTVQDENLWHALARSTKEPRQTLRIARELANNYQDIDINAQSNQGLTPLMLAVEMRNVPMVSFLTGHQADTTICTNDGYTALSLAQEMRAVARRHFIDELDKIVEILEKAAKEKK